MNETTIFANALEKKTKEELTAYLDQACSGNQELRQKIEKLLAASNGTDPILDQKLPPMPSTCSIEISEKAGSSIGSYRLMEQIGEGGFGLVFVAEQQTPVRRRVALKVIKPGMDSKQVIARFEAERQALALMDHPNIAKVLDVGSTESGLPFFVMELVRGVPITEYCDTNHLDPAARLEIFISVCKAIQHAHQKGVIHRDIKPSNVLVTSHDGKPVAKVIDFGVAKAIHQPLTDRTIYTQFSQMIGTPLYMSPEQAEMSGLDIDTRSDIYSLGVLLYELLTGSTPLEKKQLVSAAYDEIRRLIREEEPPKPSQRLSASETLVALSASRATEPARLTKLLRGEVDWIVMKALEKDRTRRYDTAGALAADVSRYLSNDPVEACPPSTLYRLQKAFRRNRTAIGAGGVLAVSLLLGILGTTWFAIHANRQAEVALEQKRLAEVTQENAEVERNKAESARNLVAEKNESLLKAQERQREMLYASDMNIIQTAWNANDHRRATRLLNKHRPLPGERDLRGFEWNYWNRKLHAEYNRVQLVGRIPKSQDPLPDTLTALGSDGTHFAIFDPITHLLRVMEAGTARVLWEKRLSSNPWYLDLDQENQVIIVVNYEFPTRTDRYEVFDSKSGEELYQKKVVLPHLSYLRMRPFSKAGSRIATILPGDEKDSLLVWDVRSGKDLASYPFPKRQLEIAGTRPIRYQETYQRVSIGKDEKTFGIQTLRVGVGHLASWYDETGLKIEIPMGNAGYFAMSPDGSLLVIAKVSENGRQVLEFRDGRDFSQIKQTFEVPKLSSANFLYFTADSQFLLSSTYDAPGLFLVDCRDAEYRWRVLPSQSEILHASFEPKSYAARWFNQEGQIISRSISDLFEEKSASIYTTWRMTKSNSTGSRFSLLPSIGENAKELGESNMLVVDGGCSPLFQLNDVTDGRGTRCAFSGDGKRLALLAEMGPVGAASHELRLLDATSGRELAKTMVQLRTPFANSVEAPVALDFNGNRIACICLEDKVTNRRLLKIWHANDFERELLSVPAEEMDEGDLHWSNDGRFLLGRSESALHLCDVSTGRKLWSSGQPSLTACFSRDCNWLLSVESETKRRSIPSQKEKCQLVIRESLTGIEIDRLELGERPGPSEPVTHYIALSPDKRYVAAILQESQISIWDLAATTRMPKILQCGWGTVFAVAFSDDGNRLVTSAARRWGTALDSNGETSVWNHVTGEQLLTIPTSSSTLVFESEGQVIHGARRTRFGLSQIEIDARPIATELEAIHWTAALQEMRYDGEPLTKLQMLEVINADRLASQEVRDATMKEISKRLNGEAVEAGWRLASNRDSDRSKLERAVTYFRDASESGSSDPTLWLGLALAHARLEDPTQATQAMGKLEDILKANGMTTSAEDKAVETFVDLAKDSKIDLLARVREIRLTPSRDELKGRELVEFLLTKLPVPDPESNPSYWVGKYLVPKPSRPIRHTDGIKEFPFKITKVEGKRIYSGTSWIEHRNALLADDAELYLTRHIQMFPEDLDALRSRSEVRRGFGKIKEALEDLDKAISVAESLKNDFEKDWFRLEKVSTLFQNGEYAKAVDVCSQIDSDLKPIRNRVLSIQAWVYACCPEEKFRDGAKAVILANEACEVGGWSNYRLVGVLAQAYAEAGDFDEAIRWIDIAIKLAGRAEVRLEFEKYRQKFLDKQPHRHESNPGPLFK